VGVDVVGPVLGVVLDDEDGAARPDRGVADEIDELAQHIDGPPTDSLLGGVNGR
jgi:hypothetical protein